MKLKKSASLLLGIGMMCNTLPAHAMNSQMKNTVVESFKNRPLDSGAIFIMCQKLVKSLRTKTDCRRTVDRLKRDLKNSHSRTSHAYMLGDAMVRAYEFIIDRKGDVTRGLVAHRDSLESLACCFMGVTPNPVSVSFYENSVILLEEMIDIISKEISLLSGGEMCL